MKIKLTPVDAYQVELEGVPVGTFRIGSKWEGLTCLEAEDGGKIIAGLTEKSVFVEMFGATGIKTGRAITASPSILAKIPATATQTEDDGTPI